MPRRILSRWSWLAIVLAVVALPASADTPAAADTGDDGPYVRYLDGGIEARWVCAGAVLTQQVAVTRWPVVLAPRCAYPHPLRIRAPEPVQSASAIAGVRRLVALSDVHGQYPLMLKLLQAHGVIDANGDWTYGAGHLVMTGDLFDRGPQMTEALWHVYALEAQARGAGGAVHFLLGNHEAMVLREDLRYLHEKYPRTATALATSMPALYGGDTVLGAWLRGRRTVLQVDDLVFLHGGLGAAWSDLDLTLADTNQRFRDSLGLSKDELAQDPVLAALQGSEGPVWYRGYFLDDALTAADVDRLLRRLGARRVIVGHTSMERIETRFDGAVIAIDTSIKDGEYGEVLIVEDGDFFRGLPDGARLPLLSQPGL